MRLDDSEAVKELIDGIVVEYGTEFPGLTHEDVRKQCLVVIQELLDNARELQKKHGDNKCHLIYPDSALVHEVFRRLNHPSVSSGPDEAVFSSVAA